MAVLARGAITDRPWGQTLAALAKRGLTGQLTVSDGKPYRIAFSQGAIVGSSSPLASDAAVRLALTGGLVSSTQVAEITRRVAGSPHRDEIEVIAEAVRLAPDQAVKLRRRLVAQRAARTFSVDKGEFVIEDQITVPVIPGSELDVRAVIHLGARNNLAETRLASELAQLGAWFKLQPDAIADLAQYGFTELDKPVLQELIVGANLVEIEGDHPEVGERGVRAIVYALAACGVCEASASPVPSGRPRKPSAPPVRQSSPNIPVRTRTVSIQPSDNTPAPTISRTATPPTLDPYPRSRPTAHPAFEGPRVATPTNHPAFDRPVTARTETPTGPLDRRSPSTTTPPRSQSPTISRTQTPTAAPSMPRTASTSLPGRVPTDPFVGRAPSPQEPAVGRAPSPTGPVAPRTMTPLRPLPPGAPAISRTTSQNRAIGPAAPLPLSPSSSRGQRGSGPLPARSRTNTAATLETEALIRDRLALLERGADHFVLLGISTDATADLIRAAYFTLARKLHPDRLASLGIVDAQRDAQRVMAQINSAFAILNDNLKRIEYLQVLARGGESVVNREEQKANETAMRVMTAEEAFRRGEMALRREQLDQAIQEFNTAVELQPQEAEYGALLAWARFAAAADKQAIARETRLALQRAAERMMQSPTARFYLGRVERILGREREALEHFYEVLRIKPNHADASSEIRVLETRLKKR